MIKKKVSGQTLAIIILGALLLITITFGGVFAFYTARTSQVSGKILMANLNIALGAEDSSDKSEIIIDNAEYIVPGQILTNTPLIVRNLSTVDILLVVVYELYAKKTIVNELGEEIEVAVEDAFINPVFGLGCEYYNSKHPNYKEEFDVNLGEIYNEDWDDFVFYGERENKYYRCLVSTKPIAKHSDTNRSNAVTVIGENKLSLHKLMGSEYVDSTLSFTFQAYAVGAATDFGITNEDTGFDRCQKVVSFVYEAQGYKFLVKS